MGSTVASLSFYCGRQRSIEACVFVYVRMIRVLKADLILVAFRAHNCHVVMYTCM